MRATPIPNRSELLRIKDEDGQNGVLARLKSAAAEHPSSASELVALGRTVGLNEARIAEISALTPKYGAANAGGAHGQRRLDASTAFGLMLQRVGEKLELPKPELIERAEIDEVALDDKYGIGGEAFTARHILDRLAKEGEGKFSVYVPQHGTRDGDRIQRALMWLHDVNDAVDLSDLEGRPRAHIYSGVIAGDSPENDASYLEAIRDAKSAGSPRFKAVFEYGNGTPTVTIWSLPQVKRRGT